MWLEINKGMEQGETVIKNNRVNINARKHEDVGRIKS